jgi:NitT/TauT family transport system permease protein
MAGLDIAMILALIGAIVAEFTGATSGLGMLILSMTYTMDVSGQFSVLLILSVVGLVLNRIVSLVRRRVLFWDPSEKGVEIPEGDVTARNPLAASSAAKESVA